MAKTKVTDRAAAVNLGMTMRHSFGTPEDLRVQGLLTLQSLSRMAYQGIVNQPAWGALPAVSGFDQGYWLQVDALVTACTSNHTSLTRTSLEDTSALGHHLACLISLLDQALAVLLPKVEHPTAQSWYNYVYTLWTTAQSVAQACECKHTTAA